MQQHFDVAVIGGGIHGAGAAQAAVAAGYSTLLIERADDWATATSRASSKLIHGGLRYLESAQFTLVHHSLRERALLLRNAPELVRAVPFYIPVYHHTRRRAWQIRIGLALYALLAGLHPLARFRSVPRSEWDALDGLRRDGLQHVFQYWDAQTDDAALTHAVVRSAASLGAACLPATELLHATPEGNCHRLALRSGGRDWTCTARSLVNAAGPWVNEVAARVQPAAPPQAISLVKGTHLVLPGTARPGIFYLEAPRDGRAIFVMPWHGDQTLLGTTEVEVDTPQVTPSPAETDYLLETLRYYFPNHPDTVLDSFAGVRVLPAGGNSPFSRPREAVLTFSDGAAPVIGIYGGKLTTYRQTAEQVLKLLHPALGRRPRRADTRRLALTPH